MKFLISLLLCLSLTILPGFAEEKPFIAAYVNIDLARDWIQSSPAKLKLNMLYLTDDWDTFDDFLQRVKEAAGTRPIVIDIAAHGDPVNAHLVQIRKTAIKGVIAFEKASWGFVVNHIEKHLNIKKLVVLTEACYSGRTYRSIRGNNLYEYRNHIEDCNHIPDFPIYGSGEDFTSLNTLVFNEYIFNVHVFWTDLRSFERGFKPHNYSKKEEEKQLRTMQWLIDQCENINKTSHK